MARTNTDQSDSDRWDEHQLDRRIERDDQREPTRLARPRYTVSRERVRNVCHFADVIGASAHEEWLAHNWSSVLAANLYKAAQFAARGIGARS